MEDALIILKKHVDEKKRQGKYIYPKEIHEGSKALPRVDKSKGV